VARQRADLYPLLDQQLAPKYTNSRMKTNRLSSDSERSIR